MIIYKLWLNKVTWLMFRKDKWINRVICFKMDKDKCHNKDTNHKCLINNIRIMEYHIKENNDNNRISKANWCNKTKWCDNHKNICQISHKDIWQICHNKVKWCSLINNSNLMWWVTQLKLDNLTNNTIQVILAFLGKFFNKVIIKMECRCRMDIIILMIIPLLKTQNLINLPKLRY